jgi:hypothetical protein
MSLRPYVVASGLFGAFLFNMFLCFFEDVGAYAPHIKQAATTDQTVNKIALADVTWSPGSRIQNMKTFGLQISEIETINKKIKNIGVDQAAVVSYLDANMEKTAKVYCGKASLDAVSPVYKASGLLVLENAPNTPREVIPIGEVLAEFGEQPWYRTVAVDTLYRNLETGKGTRDAAATVYGVGALLAAEEGKAIKEGSSVFVSYERFFEDRKGISIRNKLVDYFANFFVFVEAANGRNGICGKTAVDEKKPQEGGEEN